MTINKIVYKVREELVELIKGLLKNPYWLIMRYLGRFSLIRYWIKQLWVKISQSPSSSVKTSSNKTIFAEVNIDTIVEEIRGDGFSLGLYLPLNLVEEIRSFAYNTPCYANRKVGNGFYYSQREFAQAQIGSPILTGYYFNTASTCKAIQQLAQDSILREIAAHYFQASPKHIGNQLWWSFATSATYESRQQAAQSFHYDLDDWQFLKFFFYLTDVDSTSGPHMIVKGTHLYKPFLHQLKRRGYSDEQIEKRYGKENIKSICGKAGLGFVEDPLCFHKGMPPITRDRLCLQIEFALHDYGMQNDLRPTSLLKVIN